MLGTRLPATGGGKFFTVSVAGVLVIDPARLDTVTVKTAPLSFSAVAGVVYVELVAPVMATPFLNHW